MTLLVYLIGVTLWVIATHLPPPEGIFLFGLGVTVGYELGKILRILKYHSVEIRRDRE